MFCFYFLKLHYLFNPLKIKVWSCYDLSSVQGQTPPPPRTNLSSLSPSQPWARSTAPWPPRCRCSAVETGTPNGFLRAPSVWSPCWRRRRPLSPACHKDASSVRTNSSLDSHSLVFCVCVRVCERESLYVCTYCMYIYTCVCTLCTCVYTYLYTHACVCWRINDMTHNAVSLFGQTYLFLVLAADRLFYIYTSGTTGMPKAAIVVHSR